MTVVIEKPNLKIIAIEVPEEGTSKTTNFYLVEKNSELFLIDAGYSTEKYWTHFQDTLKEHGYLLSDLTAILLTHHHIDHVGVVYRIAEKTDVPVYMRPYAIPILKGDPEFIYMNYLFSKDLFHKLNGGDFAHQQIYKRYNRQLNSPLSALNWNIQEIHDEPIFGFETVHIPGHALDQTAFYLKDEGIIFSGDLLIDHLRTNAFIDPDLSGNKTDALLQHRESLEKIIDLKPSIAFSGHGTSITNPAKLAKRRLHAIDIKAESFLTMIEAGVATGSEIAKHRHPQKYEQLFAIIMSDALSFLEYLENKGEIYKEEKNGIWHYKRGTI